MNTNKKIKLFGAIIGIVMFILLIAGISYAWITWSSSNVAISGSTECVDMNYVAGQDIVDANVLLFDESKIVQDNKITIKKGMALTSVIASAKDCTINEVNLGIGLDATSINDAYFNGDSVGAFKYAIAKYDHNTYTDVSVDALEGLSFELIEYGSVTKSGESVLTNKISLNKDEIGVLVIFYIDGYLAGNSIANTTFSGSILGMVMQGKPTGVILLTKHIKNLYTSNKPTLITQEESNDTYYYSYQDTEQTWGLMNDGLTIDTTQDATTTGLAKVVTDTTALTTGAQGNIRYFGPSDKVNNYIYFNCNDYNNQSLTDENGNKNCELWRIIGIVDGKVKIRRSSSIGNLAWDQDKNQNYSLTTYSNNWQTSSLQLFLNGLYYNRGATANYTYYSGFDGSFTTILDLKTIGITEETRANDLISESIWYLGGYNTVSKLYPNDIYNYERQNKVGTTILSGNPYTIIANIGLMYASDYGYGVNLIKCSKDISNYKQSGCPSNNWLYNNGQAHATITPNSSNSHYIFGASVMGHVFYDGIVYGQSVAIFPVLYLNSKVGIDSDGDGTSTNPYRINPYYKGISDDVPVCMLSVNAEGITISSMSSDVTSYGLSTTEEPSYGRTSLELSTGVKYGHVKNDAGMTGICSVEITTPNYYDIETKECTSSNYSNPSSACSNVNSYVSNTCSFTGGYTKKSYTCKYYQQPGLQESYYTWKLNSTTTGLETCQDYNVNGSCNDFWDEGNSKGICSGSAPVFSGNIHCKIENICAPGYTAVGDYCYK